MPQPKVIEISSDFQFLLGLLPQMQSMFSQLHSPMANFDPYSFILNVGQPKSPLNSLGDARGFKLADLADELDAKLKVANNLEDKVKIAITSTAWIHELQHFRDCLFTPSGAVIFLREAIGLHSILAKLAAMRKSGRVIRHPLGRTRDFLLDDNPIAFEISTELFDLFCQRSFFNGDLSALDLAYDPMFDEVLAVNLTIDMNGRALKLPFFPMRGSVDGKMFVSGEPLGFRALTEARATHMQNEIISMVAPELITDVTDYWRYIPEYATCNMLFTKAAKLAGVENGYRASHEFMVGYCRWLFHSLHGGGSSSSLIGYPGQVALALAVENLTEHGFEHESFSAQESEVNEHLQNWIRDEVDHFGNDAHFVPAILRFVSDNWLLPALKRYRNHDDWPIERDLPLESHVFAFDDAEKLMSGPEPLPNPIAYFHNGKLSVNGKHPVKAA
jgi:hypothetical protein